MYSRKEFFSIPNILGYFRILLIPVFMYLYFTAETVKDYYIAVAVMGVSSISDMLDGLIARRFNMVTELGKLVDPLADKLTQGALIICFLNRFSLMLLLLVIYVVKESFMTGAGIVVLRHNGRRLNGANWYGKVSTAALYIAMFLILLLPTLPLSLVNALIIICSVLMVLSFLSYIPVFVKLYRQQPENGENIS